jgi:phosphoribosylformylglycinamidine synthase
MKMNKRIFVEKKLDFQTSVEAMTRNIKQDLNIHLNNVRMFTVYELFDVAEDAYNNLKWKVFAEKPTDDLYEEINLLTFGHLGYAYLPGQYDVRADSAMQCAGLLGYPKLIIKSAYLVTFDEILKEELSLLERYLINPVEMEKIDLFKAPSLHPQVKSEDLVIIQDFISYSKEALSKYYNQHGFAMKIEDLFFIQNYFIKINRNPTETELFVLDTYWSDHCRHTTFETELQSISFDESNHMDDMKQSLNLYLDMRKALGKEQQPIRLMDLATLYAKYMIQSGLANDVEISEEVNACSVRIYLDGEAYLLMFKNETHNHPTEIEPFGGAATCIGGAIRDPLSGRAYVYQAARVTGASNILIPVKQTRKGKLPQSIITKKATQGFSSYGNQIGLATTLVREIYHPGYEAKRLELGAVVGVVKESDIQRKTPSPGDFIILIGGATGRDGVGGATGSSKSHNIHSIHKASSEVQKGNALIERKLQRLFLHPEVTKIIKKANDFGAGGVAVAIGELAKGISINLDLIPTKYQGLNATELAISESQERMAIVISPKDYDILNHYVHLENITCHHVATVTDDDMLTMMYQNQCVVKIHREFLDSHGIRQKAHVHLSQPSENTPFNYDINSLDEAIRLAISAENTASQKGMIEYFDSTIGSTTILMPFGGKTYRTEVDTSVQKIPIQHNSSLCSLLSFGFDPNVMTWSPYHGAYLAIVESIAKIVSVHGDYRNIRFSFQEYFRKMGNDPMNWGTVFAALLGAFQAQIDFKLPAIGGKDSMSGSFEDIHVPPTFVAFAVTTAHASEIISPEFKEPGNYVYMYQPKTKNHLPMIKDLMKAFDFISTYMTLNHIISAKPILKGGWLEAILKMSFGNQLGVHLSEHIDLKDSVNLSYGGIVFESRIHLDMEDLIYLGEVIETPLLIHLDYSKSINDIYDIHTKTYESIYPIKRDMDISIETISMNQEKRLKQDVNTMSDQKPKVIIAVFPGSNCELDSKRAFEDAGADVELCIFRNQNQDEINASLNELKHAIDVSDIFMIPGGFSAGDEPDGSGKFIASILINDQIKPAIENLIQRKGLVLGICNGFQALIKSGLLPFGRLGEVDLDSPTLTYNKINRHVSRMVRTKILSNHSPWYQGFQEGHIHQVPVSHGEGRFYAKPHVLKKMIEQNLIVTQYVNEKGEPTMLGDDNPNGSIMSIEGIMSPDGRVLGKMAHSERYLPYLYKNIPGISRENIFINAVEAIKKGV